jgi:hypothetical protein
MRTQIESSETKPVSDFNITDLGVLCVITASQFSMEAMFVPFISSKKPTNDRGKSKL